MSRRTSRLIFISLILIIGCNQQTNTQPKETASADSKQVSSEAETEVSHEAEETASYDADWNQRNAEIYRFLLAELEEPTTGRIYFITTTPMSRWGERGTWSTIPAEELKSLPNASKYRPANEAYLKDGSVLEKGKDSKAWMKWISVVRWISDTEVEVEEGVWCCPLGGGAHTNIYHKINSKWEIKEHGRIWVS